MVIFDLRFTCSSGITVVIDYHDTGEGYCYHGSNFTYSTTLTRSSRAEA